MDMPSHTGSVDSFSSIQEMYQHYTLANYSHLLDLTDNELALLPLARTAIDVPGFLSPLMDVLDLEQNAKSAPPTPMLQLSFNFGLGVDPRAITSSSLHVSLDPSTSSYGQLVADNVGDEYVYENNEGAIDDDDDDYEQEYVQEYDDQDQEYLSHSQDQEYLDQNEGEIEDYLKYGKINEHKDTGETESDLDKEEPDYVIRRTVKDFEFGKDLGEGSYSTVVLATDKLTGKQYAVKVLDKRHIIKEKKVKYVNIEKHALNRLSACPGIILLFFTFQDKYSLYFVLDYASNGELLTLIKRYGTLNEDCVRHFGAQILSAMRHMHNHGVVHRDIKPENILLDDRFRIRITDFGTAKLLEKKDDTEEYPVDVRAKSFVGTAEYVSPELLESKYCGKPGDIWAFGCILYQMVAGKPPFKATNEYLTFQKITKLQYAFSAGFPMVLRDLIKLILVLQPSRRATIPQIQSHFFFESVNFKNDELVWSAPVPELAPYKMTAKSMMKMPPKKPIRHEFKKVPLKETPKPPKSTPNTTHVPSANAPSTPSTATTAPKTPKEGRRVIGDANGNYSPANVAAFVLHKHDDEVKAHQSRPPPEYIPGTNILRPTIHSMASYSRGVRSDLDLKKKKAEIPPMSKVELAWQAFLDPATERIMHVGLAIVCKQPVEYFEKKNRGLVHDAPLALINKLQAAEHRASGRSMLSQVAHGSKGLRDTEVAAPKVDNEEDAVTFYFEEPEGIDNIPEDDSTSTAETSAAFKGRGFLKKFLSHDKKTEAVPDNASTKSSSSTKSMSLEKAKTCTVIVTTHGRLLILVRDETEPRLVAEVRLKYPFVRFKEVVSSGSKFGKMLPSTGIFAVMCVKTVFVFEVEKYEVGQWTEALGRSKLAQLEKERQEDIHPSPAPKPAKSLSPKPSPKLMASASFKKNGLISLSWNQGPQSLDPKEKEKSHLLQNKMNKSTRRKRPPPLPKSQVGVSGLGREQGLNSGTVHAAQLAVSNNANMSMDARQSSFSRENGWTQRSITSMNLKLLARTRGKK